MNIFYRKEIDGLRALSVIAVILFHAEIQILDFNLFQGGYLGVDIFFVISGFIISTLLLREFDTTEKISIISFYERRLRRIFPALIFTILISIIIGWFILLPSEFLFLSKSVINSLIFNANHFFYINEINYISEEAKSLHLLHLWSLSVEEQFYIFFPIFIFISFKILKKKKHIIKILIFFFILSLILAEIGSYNFSSATFYLLPTRGWEICAGILLSFYLNTYEKVPFQKFSQLISILSFISLILCLLLFSEQLRHPSLLTLIPVILVCLIIIYINEYNILYKILSNRYIRFLGLISFSLYLIHYIIFVFGYNLIDKPSIFQKSLWILISVVISSISFYFVEKPFRNKNKINSKKFLNTFVIFIILIILTAMMIINENGFKNRFSNVINSIDDSKIRSFRCENIICESNYDSNKNTIILLGDSTTFNMEKLFLDYNKTNFITLNSLGCPYLREYSRLNVENNSVILNCDDENQKRRLNKINEYKNAFIILSSRYTLFLENKGFDNTKGGKEDNNQSYFAKKINEKYLADKETFKKDIVKNILELLKNHKVILVYPTPEPGWHVPKKIMQIIKNNNAIRLGNNEIERLLEDERLFYPTNLYFERHKDIIELYDSIDHTNLIRYYPHKLVCDNKNCLMHDNLNIYYSDDYHFSDYISFKMFNELVELIK